MNNLAFDSRNRRNLFAHVMNAFSPPFHKNYCTDTTAEMKTPYGDSLFINTMHLIPEPMKMKLADSVVSLDEEKPKTNMAADTKGFLNIAKEANNTRSDYYPSLAGIGSFFSGVFNVMGAMFQKRANSPVQYYDCFEQGFEEQHQMTPSALAWQGAKHEDLNKNGRAETDDFADDTFAEMSGDFRSIAAQCEDKLNRVRLLLSGNTVQRAARQRRPKRAFHEASSVEELFEDAFTPEDFINLANETFLEYCSPFNNHHEEKHQADAPKIKTETIKESMEIIQNVSPKDCDQSKPHTDDKCEESDKKKEVVTSCEDKVNQLKALLQRRRQKPNKLDLCTESTDSDKTPAIPIPNCTDTPKTTDVIFVKDIELPSSPESPHVLEPNSYFDEVTGRFYSSSATDSEDSFQIVFSDSPRTRKRIPSDCESEDSFIVFEESPDSCYTSNDVFGDEIDAINSDSDCESDCGSEFDSGVGTITLSHSLSRTFGDLTDGSLYEDRSEDVVDCAFRSGSELPMEAIDEEKADEGPGEVEDQGGSKGLLLTEAKKRERKKLPPKKVQFSSQPPRVHVMRVWAFAARQARAGHWERHALDRERFKRRIADVEVAVSWVLKPQHRSRVMFQRFMPWWNAQRRKELAEKKQREEDRVNREKEELERLEAELRLNEEVHAEDCANTTDDTNGDERKTEELVDTNGGDKRETEELVDNNNGVEAQEVSCRIVDVNCKVDDRSIKTDKVVLNSNVDSKIEEKSIVCKTQDKVRDRIDTETLCNGNSDVNCNDIDGLDDQIVSQDKLIGQSKANTDSDKTICDELSKVTVNGDVIGNNNGLRNGMKVPDCKMICYKQQQVL